MSKYKYVSLGENVEEMFIGPFGSCLKNECFVNEDEAYCMVYEQKHAIQKTMDVETRYVNEQKYNELKRFNIHGGDIIVSCRGTIGETFIVPADAPLGIMHPSIMKIRLKDGVYDKYYFNLLLMSRLKKHEAEANGSGIKMVISATELGKELFPVPTMEEQKEITDIISKISYVIEKRKQELSDLDELIKSRFVEMFGDPVSNSMGLPTESMTEVCAIIDGDRGKNYPKQDEFFDMGHCLFLNAKNVTAMGFSFENCMFITEEKDNSLRKGKIVRGDVVLTTRGTLGNLAFYDDSVPFENVRINSGMVILRMKKNIVTEVFFIEQFKLQLQSIKEKIASGSAQPQLPISTMNKIRILLAPIELQEQFAAFVEQVDKSKLLEWINLAKKSFDLLHERICIW